MREGNKKRVGRFLGAVGVLAASAGGHGAASASPLISISIQARPTGSAQAFSSTIPVIGGTTYDYIVLATMAPLGTSNATGAGTTINSLTYNSHASTGDGIANLKFDLFENAGDPIQLDIASAGTLSATPVAPSVAGDNVSWSGGTGPSGGTSSARSGGAGSDLLAVRPVHATGVQTAVSAETLLSGQFTLPAVIPQQTSSQLRGRWTSGGTGVFKVNGGSSLAISSAVSEAGADPYVGFTPLAITTPEPTCLALGGLCSVLLLGRRRRNR